MSNKTTQAVTDNMTIFGDYLIGPVQ